MRHYHHNTKSQRIVHHLTSLPILSIIIHCLPFIQHMKPQVKDNRRPSAGEETLGTSVAINPGR